MRKAFPLNLGGSDTCYFCKKRVYVMERLSAEGHFFHRECFRCSVCASTLRLAAYAFDSDEGNSQGPGMALPYDLGCCTLGTPGRPAHVREWGVLRSAVERAVRSRLLERQVPYEQAGEALSTCHVPAPGGTHWVPIALHTRSQLISLPSIAPCG